MLTLDSRVGPEPWLFWEWKETLSQGKSTFWLLKMGERDAEQTKSRDTLQFSLPLWVGICSVKCSRLLRRSNKDQGSKGSLKTLKFNRNGRDFENDSLPFPHTVHLPRIKCPLIVYPKPTVSSAPSPVRTGPFPPPRASWVPVDTLSI